MIEKKIFDFNEAEGFLRKKYDIGKDFKLELQFINAGTLNNTLTPFIVFVKDTSK